MKTKKIVYTALFIALGVLLPQAFHLVGATGPIFLPMHIPTILAGMFLGPISGLIVGILTPIISHFTTMMPQIPILYLMIVELSIYGFLSGLFYKNLKLNVYVSLILAMILGRFGASYAIPLVKYFMPKINMQSLTYLKTIVVTGIPGIVIQLILIPLLVTRIKGVDSHYE